LSAVVVSPSFSVGNSTVIRDMGGVTQVLFLMMHLSSVATKRGVNIVNDLKSLFQRGPLS